MIALPAIHNHGRWIVGCPFCKSAEKAADEFMCSNCHNEAVAWKPMPVAWPKNQKEIEKLLMERPEIKTRNWSPTETIQDLARENAQRGI